MRLRAALWAAAVAPWLALSALAGTVSFPYESGLASYSASAAKAFLADTAAQTELRLSAPALLVPSIQRAHEILELDTLPGQYDDAADLRRAFIARDSEPSFEKAADVRAFYASRGLPPEKQLMVARALCEWRTLSPDLRSWLVEAGFRPEGWKDMLVSQRAGAIVVVMRVRLLSGPPLTLDGAAYRARWEVYARRVAPFLSASEDYALEQDLDKHERLVADLRAARRRARDARDEAVSAMLAETARMETVDEARDSLDAVLEREKPGSVAEKIPKKTLRAIARRLPALIKEVAKGTPAEAVLEEALESVRLEPLPTSIGGYVNGQDALKVSSEQLAAFLRARGRRSADLLEDEELLREFALRVAPVVVHETTHRLQKLRGEAHAITTFEAASLYGHEDEREAFTVQELFVRAYAKRHPEKAAELAADEELSFFWTPETIRKSIDAIPLGYSNVPGYHGSRARVATLARYERDVAERRKKPVVGAPTGVAGEIAEHDRFMAYLDGMAARLKAWTRRVRRSRRP